MVLRVGRASALRGSRTTVGELRHEAAEALAGEYDPATAWVPRNSY
ncbi:hypothetical protein ACWD00_33225 [Streptomyces viridiviolaceus]